MARRVWSEGQLNGGSLATRTGPTPGPPPPDARSRIGFFGAVSIGVGGMIGAGIFAILGVVTEVSGTALPISFAVGGFVALLAAYSYVKLGVRYPTVGGSVEYLVRGYGDGLIAGSVNTFQYLAYVIAIALYAKGFGGYAATFLPADAPAWSESAFAVGVVAGFCALNFLGTAIMGRAETLIVGIKVGILVVFIVAAMFTLDVSRLAPSGWANPADILFGAGILFIGYEGFGLVCNAAGAMANPRRMLPAALYTAVGVVIAIYLLVAVGVIGNVSTAEMVQARDFALAQAARPVLGAFGFKMVAVAALLSTASAVNATLFGSANVAYQVALDGELPQPFQRRLWVDNGVGLLVTAGLVIAALLAFDLGPIAMMGSAAFLVVYIVVGVGHLRIIGETGARRSVVAASILSCAAMLVALCFKMVSAAPPAASVTLAGAAAASLIIEASYRKATGRKLTLTARPSPKTRA